MSVVEGLMFLKIGKPSHSLLQYSDELEIMIKNCATQLRLTTAATSIGGKQ